MFRQFWGRAAKGVLSLTAQGVFLSATISREPICVRLKHPTSVALCKPGRVRTPASPLYNLACDGDGDATGAKNGIHCSYDLLHGSVDV